MKNINDKVAEWIKDNLGIIVSELKSNDQRVRMNTDGTILINFQLLKDKGLDKKYLQFLESLK